MSEKSKDHINFWKATYFGLLFLVLYVPFMTVQNLLSEIQKASGFGNLGFVLLAVLYLFQMIGSIFSAAIASKLGIKWTLIMGGLNLAMVVFSQTIPAWRVQENQSQDPEPQSDFVHFLFKDGVIITILVLGSVLAGFGQAIIWVAQGEYMTYCATPNTKGFYFGYFWAIYMSSQVVGNWIGSILILKTSGPIFFLIMGGIMIFALFGFLIIKKPRIYEEEMSVDQITDIRSSVNEEKETFLQVTMNVLKLMVSKKMMLLNMQLIWTGASIAYWSGILTPIMVY